MFLVGAGWVLSNVFIQLPRIEQTFSENRGVA